MKVLLKQVISGRCLNSMGGFFPILTTLKVEVLQTSTGSGVLYFCRAEQ